MDNKLLEALENLNIDDTDLLLDEDINLIMNASTRKRIEESVMKKAGYHGVENIFTNKINNILGGLLMKRKIALVLSAVLVLGLGGGSYAYAKTTPVAYVSLDINPSVELGVNTFDQVVSVEAYNEDGEKVLEGTNLVNNDVDDAVNTIITNAISDGYIKADDIISNDGSDATAATPAAVEITVSTDKENVANKLEESLKEAADKTLENNDVEAGVETDNVALARRDEARQLGITPGKLNLIQKLQALDPTIKVEDYKSASVKNIQKKAKELRKAKNNTETITDNNTTNDTGTNTNYNTTTNNSGTDVISGGNTQESGTVSELSVDSDKDATTEARENNDKNNNGMAKKEENTEKHEEKTSKESEKKNDDVSGNSNSSKSEKTGNGNSNAHSSGNKGNGKNK